MTPHSRQRICCQKSRVMSWPEEFRLDGCSDILEACVYVCVRLQEHFCEHNLAITQTRISDLMVNQRQFGKLLENHCVTLCAGQGNMSACGSE